MAVPSCPASCPGLIRVIRESQSERAAVGVRGHTFLSKHKCHGNIPLRFGSLAKLLHLFKNSNDVEKLLPRDFIYTNTG